MTDARPVSRSLAACAYATVVAGGLFIGDRMIGLSHLYARPPGAWTATGMVLILLLALAGAGLAAIFDRLQRPRGIFILGLVILFTSAILNLIVVPELRAFFSYPKELLLWGVGVGLLVYALLSVSWIGRWGSILLLGGFIVLDLARSAYSFGLIFSHNPGRLLLSALLMATLFGAAIRVRRRLLQPLKWDLAAAAAALLLALTAQVGVAHYLASRGSPPAPAAGGVEWGKPARPFLILIVWDTVRRDHLSLYGYNRPTTPLLDQWSKQARVFTDARTVAPWTLPAHASMFSGLYPRSHGANFVFNPGHDASEDSIVPLDESFVTLAERLAAAGFQTGAVSSNNVYAGRRAGMSQGFDYFYDQTNVDDVHWPLFDLQNWLVEVLTPYIPSRFFSPYLSPYMTAEEVTDRALTWLDSLDHDRPFFLFLNYMDAHEPNYPPEELRYMFPGFQRDLISRRISQIYSDVLEQDRPLTAREHDHLVSQYDAQLVRLDRETDRLRRELVRRGILDNAFLVLVSDHGEFFGEHGELVHANEVYDELLRIPMVIRRPGGAEAGTDPRPIENRELFRIFLGEAGLNPPPETHPWDQAAELYPSYRSLKNGRQLTRYARTLRAVIFGQYKFIASSDGHNELYNLAGDPAESVNLDASSPLQAGQGMSLVNSFLEAVPKSKITAVAPKPDADQQRTLRALGYIQ